MRSEPGSTRAPVGTRQALIVLLATGTLVIMAGSVVSPVLTLIRDEFGLSSGVAGLVVTLHALLIAVSSPFVGVLIDRIGTKKVLGLGLLAYAVFGAAGALATSFAMLIGSRILFGVAAAAVLNASTVSLLNLWQDRQRDAVMGYWASSNSAGGVFWPIVAGALGSFGWRAPFAVYLVALPILVALVFLLPDTRPGRPGGPAAGDAEKTSMAGIFRRAPTLYWLCALVFIIQLELYAIVVFVPQRLAEMGVAQPLVISIAIAAVNVVAGGLGLWYARLRSRFGFRTLFLIGTAVPAVAFGVLAAASAPWLVFVGTPLFGLSLPLLLASAPALLGRLRLPPSVRGRAVSFQNSMMLLGQFVSPLVLGLLVPAFGLRAPFAAVAVLAVVETVAVAWAFHPDRRLAVPPDTPEPVTAAARPTGRSGAS